MIEGLGEVSGCSVGEILQFAEINDLLIIQSAEFNKTVIFVFCIGVMIGIICWEIGKYMYHYGKQCSENKD